MGWIALSCVCLFGSKSIEVYPALVFLFLFCSNCYFFTLDILHLRLSHFSRRLTTNFTLKIIVSFFCEAFHDLNYTLMIKIYRKNFCENGCSLSAAEFAGAILPKHLFADCVGQINYTLETGHK